MMIITTTTLTLKCLFSTQLEDTWASLTGDPCDSTQRSLNSWPTLGTTLEGIWEDLISHCGETLKVLVSPLQKVIQAPFWVQDSLSYSPFLNLCRRIEIWSSLPIPPVLKTNKTVFSSLLNLPRLIVGFIWSEYLCVVVLMINASRNKFCCEILPTPTTEHHTQGSSNIQILINHQIQ